MGCPASGPCTPFVTQELLCCLGPSGTFPSDPCLDSGEPISQELIDNAIQAASELMWAATGRRFGTCEVTIRPCKKTCDPCPDSGLDFFGINGYGWGAFPWYPHFENGIWTNVSCNTCPGQCGCSALCELALPYPTCSIEEVRINGLVLDEDQYRIDDFYKIVRIAGASDAVTGVSCWPTCQDLALPDTEEGTFSITLTYGREVPQLVKMATAELACQLLKSCVGAPCQLPQRISSLTRQGVTVGFLDPQDFLESGRTGIYIVDLAIKTFNPHKLQRNASVYSVDNHPKWRRTDTGQ